MNKKEFNRNICFTFFEDYRKTAKEIEEDFGKEAVADFYNAIIDYALYEIEPELKGVLKYTWHTIKTTIDKNVEKRSSGFRENTEQTEKILKYKEENPKATQREIAEATGVSLGKVNKVLKASSITSSITNTITNTSSSSNTIREHEHEHEEKKEEKREKERDLEDLTDEELESIISDYSKKVSYKATRERLNLNRQVTKDTHKEVESILAQRAAKARYKETVDTLGFDLDSNVTLDMAYHFATEILKFKVSKEEMQDDMNIHAKYGQPYTWNDFVNPPKPINRSSFYDYTAGLCSMLN